MRRQLGADTVDLDTEEGLALYTLRKPRTIDFAAIEQAAFDASYTLSAMTLELKAEAFRTRCETCDAEVTMLQVPETGQRLEAIGDVPLGEIIRIRASVTGWGTPHPRITVLE